MQEGQEFRSLEVRGKLIALKNDHLEYLVAYGVCLNWTFSGTDREKETE